MSDEWTNHFARLVAYLRVGDSVYTDGSHHPLSGEMYRARLHMRDMHHAEWRQLDTDDTTVDRVAHAIHDVHCGCDGSMYTNANPDLSPRMARAAIWALLEGVDQ